MSDWESVNSENLVKHAASGTYYLRAKIHGKIVRRSLRTTKLRIAKMKRDDLLMQLRSNPAPVDGKPIDLRALAEMARCYYASIPSYQAKPRSLEYRKELLAVLERTLPGKPSRWTEAGLRGWWASDAIVGYCATRRNNMLGTLRKMIELRNERGGIQDDPSASLKHVKVRRGKISVPSKAEFEGVIARMREDYTTNKTLESARFVQFMAYSGCRIGEVREIRWGDIGGDMMLVTGGAGGTKNHEERDVPIVSAMESLLAEMERGNDDDLVFSIASPRKALRSACDHVGVTRFTPHTCRHYFATTCIESGVDIPTVARWLGHKDGGALAMRTYGHLRSEHSKRAAKRVRF
ncbi:MAG: tyrosine-type recombinase/integrase [Akkermansiaceae bacterium]